MSGFLTTLPANVVLDAGVLSINGSTFGVSRGGIRCLNNEVWQNLDFDGKTSDVYLLDRKTRHEFIIEGTFIEMSKSRMAIYSNHGGIAGMASQSLAVAAAFSVATAATYSAFADGIPQKASQTCTQGQYAKDVRVTYKQGGGTTMYINLALAYVDQWSMVGGNADAAEISARFRAVLDFVTTNDTDVAIHTLALTT